MSKRFTSQNKWTKSEKSQVLNTRRINKIFYDKSPITFDLSGCCKILSEQKCALLYSPFGRIMRAIVQRTKASLGRSITGTEYENPPYD